MVLRPVYSAAKPPAASPAGFIPAWEAVARRQKRPADAYWLISQPDHAALSGDLAANFISNVFPRLDAAMVRIIGLHDAGWSMFPHESTPGPRPPLSSDGRPLSFVEFAPSEFLRAWTGSIERAEAVAPVGGVVVSRHFCALAAFRLKQGHDAEADSRLVCEFLERERARQRRLASGVGCSGEQLERLVGALQFCDLLSLYLCSGADDPAEFPQRFGGPVRIRRSENPEMYILNPSPFQAHPENQHEPLRTVSLVVKASLYPPNGGPSLTTLSFLLC